MSTHSIVNPVHKFEMPNAIKTSKISNFILTVNAPLKFTLVGWRAIIINSNNTINNVTANAVVMTLFLNNVSWPLAIVAQNKPPKIPTKYVTNEL